ncbi:unnamed protein product [Effrenium voratum]|nr:unnamed protein product [Effrenium voratum]
MHAAFEVRMCDQSFASAQLSVARAMEALPQLMPRADKKRLSTRPSYGMLDKADRQGRFTTALPCEAAQRVDVDQAGRLETSRAVRCTCTFGCQVSSSQACLTRMKRESIPPGLTCFNSLLHACARAGDTSKADEWLAHMRAEKLQPDAISFNTVISAHSGDERSARAVMQDMRTSSIQPSVRSYVALASQSERAGRWALVLARTARISTEGSLLWTVGRIMLEMFGRDVLTLKLLWAAAMPFDAEYLPEHLRLQLLKEARTWPEEALRLDPDLQEEDLARGIMLQLDDLPEQMGRAISREAFLRDLQWCPRNFLHRYRLAFKDLDDVPREAIAPLPEDLRGALDKLQPMDPWSASVMAQWLDPTWRCKAWHEIDVMPQEISDENIRRDKQARFPDGIEPVEVRERRVDPFDGKRYSLAELIEKYKDEFDEKDVKSYWRHAMKPNEYKVVD